MGHRRWMSDEGFHSAERFSKGEALEAINEGSDGSLPSLQFEAHHRPEACLLSSGEFVSRMIGQPRIVDRGDRRMPGQQLGHRRGILEMSPDPGMKGAKTAQ